MIKHVLTTLILFSLCTLLAASIPASGQATSATLLATVTDASGAAVPNVKVTITAPATGVSYTAQTNGNGNYTFPDLTPGTYSVGGKAQSFTKARRNDEDVVVNSTTRIDLTLKTGSVSETIAVTGAPPILQTDRADVSFKIEAQQVEDMPLAVNRNFQGLLNLIPGTTPATYEHSQFFNAHGARATRVNA